MMNTKPKSLSRSVIEMYGINHPKNRTHFEIIKNEEGLKSLLHIEIPPK